MSPPICSVALFLLAYGDGQHVFYAKIGRTFRACRVIPDILPPRGKDPMVTIIYKGRWFKHSKRLPAKEILRSGVYSCLENTRQHPA